MTLESPQLLVLVVVIALSFARIDAARNEALAREAEHTGTAQWAFAKIRLRFASESMCGVIA